MAQELRDALAARLLINDVNRKDLEDIIYDIYVSFYLYFDLFNQIPFILECDICWTCHSMRV